MAIGIGAVSGGRGGGALIVATRSDNNMPAVFADVAARDTYTATMDGTADANRINVTNADDAREVFVIGTLSGSDVTSITAAYIRLNGAWVSVATNLVGTPGQDGADLDLSNVEDNYVPAKSGNDLVSAPLRMQSDGNIFVEGTPRFESESAQIGPGITLSGLNSFLAAGNTQIPGVQFIFVDSRQRTTGPSFRARRFHLTEAQNPFEIQGDNSVTISTFPLTFQYQVTLDSQTNSVLFEVASEMTNVRAKVSYGASPNADIRFWPSEEAWESGAGGATLPTGVQMIDLGRSQIRTFATNLPPGAQPDIIVFEIRADGGSLLGNSSNFPHLDVMLQRGEFRDLADTRDITRAFDHSDHSNITAAVEIDSATGDPKVTLTASGTITGTAQPSIHNFSIDIPSRVDLNTNLNTTHNVTFDVSNFGSVTDLDLIVTVGDDVQLLNPSTDGDQSQSVTLSGIDTSTAGTVSFRLQATHAGGTVTSNTRTINIRNLEAHEFTYLNTQADNDPANFTTTGAASAEYQTSQTLNIPTFIGNRYVVIGQLQSEPDITSIMIGGLEQFGTFEKVAGTAQVNSETFEFYYSRNTLLGSAVSNVAVTISRG